MASCAYIYIYIYIYIFLSLQMSALTSFFAKFKIIYNGVSPYLNQTKSVNELVLIE